MTSKERILTTLNHQQPDRIPLDLGASGTTGLHVKNIHDLRNYFGLEPRPVKAYEPYQMLGLMEADLLDILEIDVAGIGGRKTMLGFDNDEWKPWKMDIGLEVLISRKFEYDRQPDGSIVAFPEGDRSVPPSVRMPKNGYFFDSIIRQKNFTENELNPNDNLEEFKLIEEADRMHFARELKLQKEGEMAVMASFGGTGLGDIALVPGPFMKNPSGIRDITEWYMSTLIRQDYIHQIFDKQTEIALSNLASYHQAFGDQIDILFICGTDFGTQTSTFCSQETYQQLYHPYYKRINDWIHKNTSWKTFKHSCGAVFDFIPLFIESGFDILNPVQLSAKGMHPETLKKEYGNDIVFWGGGIDTQKTLPFGSADEIRKDVLHNCEIFSVQGGFVFNTVHNIQGHTPVENIVAMLNALREFNGQPLLSKAK